MLSIQLLDSEDSEDFNNKGGGTNLTGGVSNELAGLCVLLGCSQTHQVILNATQVLQVQYAMTAHALTEAEAVLQAKIDAEVEKRTTEGLAVLPPPSLAKPKPKTVKTADVALDPNDDGVSLASGRLTVFEEAFDIVAAAATKKKPSGCSSEDDTRPNKDGTRLILNCAVPLMRSNVDCGRRMQRNPRHRTIWQRTFASSSTRTPSR